MLTLKLGKLRPKSEPLDPPHPGMVPTRHFRFPKNPDKKALIEFRVDRPEKDS